VTAAQDHWVYVRAKNRGGTPAANTFVELYWAPPSTLVTPNLWTKIGTAALGNVPVAQVFAVSPAVPWLAAAIPGPGHYCFVAVAGHALDPQPSLAQFTDFEQYLAYVQNNNNVVWRNFNVVSGLPPGLFPPPPLGAPAPLGVYDLPFRVTAAFDTGRQFGLEAAGALPPGSQATLRAPAWLLEALHPLPTGFTYDESHNFGQIPLHPAGVQHLGKAVLHANSFAPCRLFVKIPENARAFGYEFAVRQVYQGREVGRVTWWFPPLQPEPQPSLRRRSRR
jgi:hypothetical protein